MPRGWHGVRFHIEDYIGKKSGRLTAIGISERQRGERRYCILCKCECGKIVDVYPYQFKNGSVLSCGCLKGREPTHGFSKHQLYGEWAQMVRRCHNPKADNYERYGARGIFVCDEWRKSPAEFIRWVEENGGKPKGTTLDRIDNDGPYAPWNCRWSTTKTQSRNKRSNRMIEFNGETKCLADWSIEFGIARHVFENRLKRGWSIERAFTEPVNEKFSKTKNRKTGPN